MKYVLDSFVAFKWVVAEALSDKAQLVRDDYRNKIHDLLSPRRFPHRCLGQAPPSSGMRELNALMGNRVEDRMRGGDSQDRIDRTAAAGVARLGADCHRPADGGNLCPGSPGAYEHLKALPALEDYTPDEGAGYINEVMADDDAKDPYLESCQHYGDRLWINPAVNSTNCITSGSSRS